MYIGLATCSSTERTLTEAEDSGAGVFMEPVQSHVKVVTNLIRIAATDTLSTYDNMYMYIHVHACIYM